MLNPCLTGSWHPKHYLCDCICSIEGTCQGRADIDGDPKPAQGLEDLEIEEEEGKFDEEIGQWYKDV